MITVHLGNSAVTESFIASVTAEEAEAAGPLGRVNISETGETTYGILSQRPHPAIHESVTTFCDQGEVGNGYPLSNFLRDVRLAFTSQCSSAPPAWVVCSDPAVAHLISLELGGPVLAEIPIGAGVGSVGTIPSSEEAEQSAEPTDQIPQVP